MLELVNGMCVLSGGSIVFWIWLSRSKMVIYEVYIGENFDVEDRGRWELRVGFLGFFIVLYFIFNIF